MANATLETYIQTARNRGMSDDAIRLKFLEMGWSASEIEASMGQHYTPSAQPSARPTMRVPVLSVLRNRTRTLSGRWILWVIGIIVAAVLGALAYVFLWK